MEFLDCNPANNEGRQYNKKYETIKAYMEVESIKSVTKCHKVKKLCMVYTSSQTILWMKSNFVDTIHQIII